MLACMYTESQVALESNSLFVCTDFANKADSEIATSGRFGKADTYVSFIYVEHQVKTQTFCFLTTFSKLCALMLLQICKTYSHCVEVGNNTWEQIESLEVFFVRPNTCHQIN